MWVVSSLGISAYLSPESLELKDVQSHRQTRHLVVFSAHNEYLEVLAETGWSGLAIGVCITLGSKPSAQITESALGFPEHFCSHDHQSTGSSLHRLACPASTISRFR